MSGSPLKCRLLFFLLAVNYFAFRTELFSDEYEANHPNAPSVCSISAVSVNWESFDKDNATAAFVFDAGMRMERLASIGLAVRHSPHLVFACELIRDKSPPL